MDNVDLEACKELGLPISNTPGMFENEGLTWRSAIYYLPATFT